MTRMSTLRVLLGIALLSGCEMIAGIPERTLVSEPCDQFCELAGKLCTEQYAIYKPLECPAVCALYSTEERKCRQDALQKLDRAGSSEAAHYCASASLSGGLDCDGNRCKNYCDTMSKVCSDYTEANVSYPDADGTHGEECERKCLGIPDRENQKGGTNSSTFDVVKDHDGDTLQCRFVHLTLAAQGEGFAKDHCVHAYISPLPMAGSKPPWCGGPLDGVPRCEDYCDIISRACTDSGDETHKVYASEAQCLSACKALPTGNLAEYTTTNTVACRKYHSYNAVLAGQIPHCPHAGPGGAGVCGDDCESFCMLVAKGCPDEYESEYNSSASRCEKSCDETRKADPTYMNKGASYSIAAAKKGNNFACRLYNAVDATALSGDSQDACAKAVGLAPCPAF